MVSNSDIELFKRCRRKWFFGSFNSRNLIPRLPNLKFWVGTAGHYALERYHGYGEDILVAFNRWVTDDIDRLNREMIVPQWFEKEIEELTILGETILTHYVQWSNRRPEYRFKYIATEYEFSVPIPGIRIYLSTEGIGEDGKIWWDDWVTTEWGVNPLENPQFKKLYIDRNLYDENGGTPSIPALYIGRLDGLVLDENQHVKVVDHKLMASLVDSEYLLRDRQTARYVWAATESIRHGWWPEVAKDTPVRGALYNVVRKKAPVIPTLLAKSGTTSTAKNIDSTEEVFRATLLSRGENPKDPQFAEVLKSLRGKGNKFFQLMAVERGEEELEMVGANMHYEYNDMARAAESSNNDPCHPSLYATPNLNCAWDCSFRNLCYHVSIGSDVEHIIETEMRAQKRTALYATQVEEPTA